MIGYSQGGSDQIIHVLKEEVDFDTIEAARDRKPALYLSKNLIEIMNSPNKANTR